MRYVDIDDLELPDGWYGRAKNATQAVANGADPKDHEAVWRELKDHMAALLPEKKCWFCETEVDRSDNAVDHFRPKNRVSDASKNHNGYRWLAFVKENYRYACTFCNSKRKDYRTGVAGGKADRFPLLDETKRAYLETDVLDQESPVLLDPCDPYEWELLGCKRENGKPCPNALPSTENYRRASESIEIYHLDLSSTCTRRLTQSIALHSEITEAKKKFLAAQKDSSRESDFKRSSKKIRKLIDRKSPFSGEMIYLLKTQRDSDHPWIQRLIEGC